MRTLRFPSMIVAAVAVLCAAPAGADAPEGHFEVNGGTVEDTATGLSWQRSVADENHDAQGALSYCAGLELAGNGWRLPTIKELHTLVDETRTKPAIDPKAFPGTPPAHFWTSSAVAGFSSYAWAINFADGTDIWHPRENRHLVRCVR
jgi:hypothetical protein